MTQMGKLKIVIIEDNAGDARLLMEMLKAAEGLRFDITWVDRLAVGIDHLHEKGGDLVLLDLSLPDSFGLDTFERLRQKIPDTPVIIMTGNADEELAVKAVRAGAQDYIFKGTLDENSLGRTVIYALERHRLQAELKAANRKIMEQQKQVVEEERLKVLLQMAGAASHELNQPLTALLGTIEIMQLEEVPVPEGWDQHIARLETAGRRISDIIKKMSSIRRVECKPYAGGEQIIKLDQSIQVLVVEDNDADFEQFNAHMAHHRQVVITRAADLAEAKKGLQAGGYDLVFLDYMLPDGKGLDLLSWMAAEQLDIPVISVSGQGSEMVAAQMIKAGAWDYLPKAAISSDTLSRCMLDALEEYQLKQEAVRATEKVVQMATRDPLTGLYNRNYMNDSLKKELARAQRYDTDLACLMLDLDYFKEINDTFGHHFGDVVLEKTASCLSEHIRETDFAFRYGGEEFVVLLPQTGINGAQTIAEKLRAAYQALQIEEGRDRTGVTVSIGVAARSQLDVADGKDLLACADKALYQAKAQGRNRVNVYSREIFLAGTAERFKYIQDRLANLAEKTRRTTVEAMELVARDMGGARFKAHNQKVVHYIERLGQRMHLQPQVVKTLQRAAVFHDFTKVLLDGVQDKVQLDDALKRDIKDHPLTMKQLMEPFDLFVHERAVLLWHHERWDGSGYPDGLAGEEIPVGARLLAVVDAMTAMISHRPYRQPYSAADAVRELVAQAGTQFDPAMVKRFLALIAEEKLLDVPEELLDNGLKQLKAKEVPKES